MNTDNSDKKLSVAIIETKQGELSGFEDLFLMTYKNTYADIKASVEDEEYIWNTLKDAYVQVWLRSENMPSANLLRAWIRILIKDVAKQKAGVEITDFPDDIPAIEGTSLEEKASTTLIKIEDQLGLLDDDDDNQEITPIKIAAAEKVKAPKKSKSGQVGAIIKLILALAITAIAVFVLVKVIIAVKTNATIPSLEAGGIVTTTAETELVIADETTEASDRYGWNDVEDGKKKYKDVDGTYISDDWFTDRGSLYYFDSDGYMVTGAKTIDGQRYLFADTGECKEISRTFDPETKDTILKTQFEQFDKADEISRIVSDSQTLDSGWIYYLSKDSDAIAFPMLLRLKNGAGQLELIDDEVQGYVIVKDEVWYCKDGKMESFLKAGSGKPVTEGYQVVAQDGRYYLKDSFGRDIGDGAETTTIEGRIYRIDAGRIKYVKPGAQSIGGETLVLNPSTVDNKIYKASDGTVYLEQGLSINSLCLVGNYLYYSAVISIDSSNHPVSQIFRMNVGTGERIEATAAFTGTMLNMYYYPQKGEIYMEYAPNSLNSAYGRIAVLGTDGVLYCIDDSAQRPNSSAATNDMLELIMVQNGTVYTYWHDCSWDRSSGYLNVLSTTTLELSDANRIPLR